MDRKVCIYHFTDRSENRPIVYQKQVNRLVEFGKKYGEIKDIFVDKSLRLSEQINKKQLFTNIGSYDVLVTKDFYHINVHTGACIGNLKEFLKEGVPTYTLEDGRFEFTEAPYNEFLKVAIYHSKFVETKKETTIKRGNAISIETYINKMKYFIKTKTNWLVEDVYVDEADGQQDEKQIELLKLIRNRENYDLIVVKDFNTVHWRTAKFCKRRNNLQRGIFSLKEGYLPYMEDEHYEK